MTQSLREILNHQSASGLLLTASMATDDVERRDNKKTMAWAISAGSLGGWRSAPLIPEIMPVFTAPGQIAVLLMLSSQYLVRIICVSEINAALVVE